MIDYSLLKVYPMNIGKRQRIMKKLKFHPIGEYLFKETSLFYNFFYIKFGLPNNPDFLNILKNTFGTSNKLELENAEDVAYHCAYESCKKINYINNNRELVIACVPRSKAYFYDSSDQYLLFQLATLTGAIKATQELGINLMQKTNASESMQLIKRHTNVKTTHIRKESSINKPEDRPPYRGITKDTCHISDKFSGRNVLLIDDIYTKSIGVIEDCAQALYDNGAEHVIIYTLAFTSSDKNATNDNTELLLKIREEYDI